jgi:hypothetical protein
MVTVLMPHAPMWPPAATAPMVHPTALTAFVLVVFRVLLLLAVLQPMMALL